MKYAVLLNALLLTLSASALETGAPEKTFACNAVGYVQHWLVAGPQATLYAGPGGRGVDVRRRVIEPTPATPPAAASLGSLAANGAPWRCYAPGENFFVDCSAFYHQLTKVDFLACTALTVPRAGTLPAKFWVSGVADFWLTMRSSAATTRATSRAATASCRSRPASTGCASVCRVWARATRT